MKARVFIYRPPIVVGVAVTAKMPARRVSADVARKIAGAFFA